MRISCYEKHFDKKLTVIAINKLLFNLQEKKTNMKFNL